MSFLKFDVSDVLIVLARQVREHIRDDAQLFVMLSSLEAKGKEVVGDIPIFCDFPKLFPEKISDLSSERKVEFALDLVPSMSHVSMAPYRMSTSELSRLKKQLKDFLKKKFIRLSVSPWGVPL